MIWLKGFLQSLSMYSILPVPGLKWDSRADRFMIAMYPLVGLVLGGLWFGSASLFSWTRLPVAPSAGLLTVLPLILTGFLHLDGFMDVCDAVLSRRDKARRLEILKDSHVGAFAVISLAVLMILQFCAVFQILKTPGRAFLFLLLPVLSRGWTGFGMLRLPLLEGSSMGAWARKDTALWQQGLLAALALLAAVGLAALCGVPGLAAAAAGTAGYWLAAVFALRQLGGVSGDVSGYALCISETSALLILSLF